MPPVGFEPTISAGERPQTYALDRAATRNGDCSFLSCYKQLIGLYWLTLIHRVFPPGSLQDTDTILQLCHYQLYYDNPPTHSQAMWAQSAMLQQQRHSC